MLDKLENLRPLIGYTPVVKLNTEKLNLHLKLEYYNFFGSIKDRAAFHIIHEAIVRGDIDKNTRIVESSSGNLAVALASISNYLGLKFTPVIDPNTAPFYEKYLRIINKNVIKVEEPDEKGGYLINRIRKINELNQDPNTYWTAQYENYDNFRAYQISLPEEIDNQVKDLDYIFIAVSSGGTITGLSQSIKERFKNCKVIAVDVSGSVIFNSPPQKRYISGVGSSIVPPLLKHAEIDHIIHIDQMNAIKGCHGLLEEHGIFGGGSTGLAYWAVMEFFNNHHSFTKPNVLFLAPDKGTAYLDTIYNKTWVMEVEASLKAPRLTV